MIISGNLKIWISGSWKTSWNLFPKNRLRQFLKGFIDCVVPMKLKSKRFQYNCNGIPITVVCLTKQEADQKAGRIREDLGVVDPEFLNHPLWFIGEK